MRVVLRLFRDGRFITKEYSVEVEGKPTVLELLQIIKEKDPTVAFRAMCRASICGTCAVKVNGQHRLACNTKVSGEEVFIEPVDASPPIRDLVVDQEGLFRAMKENEVWITPRDRELTMMPEDVGRIAKASDCILCGICNNVCPPIVENKRFGGPALFTKLFSVVEDVRNARSEEVLKNAVGLNVLECVHCGNCSMCCPKGCMPERWVSVFETKLSQRGYIQKREQDFGFLGF